MTDDRTECMRQRPALRGVTGALRRTRGSPAAVAHWIGLVALIILVAGSLVTLMGVAPRPGPPPFLVDGEAMIVGVGVSRYLPATFALS
jgi:hypothetical protein